MTIPARRLLARPADVVEVLHCVHHAAVLTSLRTYRLLGSFINISRKNRRVVFCPTDDRLPLIGNAPAALTLRIRSASPFSVAATRIRAITWPRVGTLEEQRFLGGRRRTRARSRRRAFRIGSSSFRAQRNSVARIARPKGMTRMAGPGRTMSATPNARTLKPIMATTTFRTTRNGEDAAERRTRNFMTRPQQAGLGQTGVSHEFAGPCLSRRCTNEPESSRPHSL